MGYGRVTASWNANSESDLAGYKLYRGQASGVYSHIEDVGMTTSTSAPSVKVSQIRPTEATWYFAVTAYDTSNNESTFSAEVALDIMAMAVPNCLSTAPSRSIRSSVTPSSRNVAPPSRRRGSRARARVTARARRCRKSGLSTISGGIVFPFGGGL